MTRRLLSQGQVAQELTAGDPVYYHRDKWRRGLLLVTHRLLSQGQVAQELTAGDPPSTITGTSGSGAYCW